MPTIDTDICIIGGGSGGLSVAAGAAQMGARVVLIESAEMGGDCLNHGCVPSKALIASADHAHSRTTGADFGVKQSAPKVDFAKAKDHVRRVIDTIAPVDSQERFEGLGVTVLRDVAAFTGHDTVQAGDTTIKARRFVIATGSSPLVPPIPGIGDVTVHTNETIFSLRDRPEHLLIVGGGPIGMEMAQAHRRLGCEVTVIEGMALMGKDDPELAKIVIDRLRAEGVTLMEGAKADRISAAGQGITVHTDKGEVTGSHLLMAVGRRTNLDRLELHKAGIATTDRGALDLDDGLRSKTNRRVYAVGDAADRLQFTHVAGYHAGVIIRPMLFGLPARAKQAHIPWATYTDPELSQVGLTEAQARETHGDNLTVVRAEYDHNDRAIATGQTTGLVKVMVVGGRPVGASIVGAQAGELIGLWAMAIANGMKMSAIANTVLPYPTLGEVNKRAASAYFTPRLFDSPWVKRIVRAVQKVVP